MLGFVDLWVFLAYVLTILVTIGCLIYGWLNWDRDGELFPPPQEEFAWAEEEEKIEESLG
ncbi:MAG: symporter small accessory protein [Candidatus Sumerlaeaceae bacterium]